MDENSILKFADYIKKSENIVFFGGAGVSTESGVKDYRSEDGLYNTVKEYGVSPETILSHNFFFRNTDVFYNFYYNYFLDSNPKPNKAHYALAELEKSGKLKAVITQNIDGLHQLAGSKNVLELHGTIFKYHCASCGNSADYNTVKAFKGAIPVCTECGGILKPDVVLYGEGLENSVIESSVKAMQNADMLIVGGTSLSVYPAANFLNYFRGNRIVLINRDETPYDSRADLIFRDKIGEVLSETLKKL